MTVGELFDKLLRKTTWQVVFLSIFFSVGSLFVAYKFMVVPLKQEVKELRDTIKDANGKLDIMIELLKK